MASINQLFPELSEKEEQKSPISSKMSDECFEHSPNIKSEASGELSGNESGGGCSGSHHHQSGMDSSCDSGRVSTPASLEGDYPLSRDSKFHDLSRGEKKNNFRPWEDDSNKTNETEHRVPGKYFIILFWSIRDRIIFFFENSENFWSPANIILQSRRNRMVKKLRKIRITVENRLRKFPSSRSQVRIFL